MLEDISKTGNPREISIFAFFENFELLIQKNWIFQADSAFQKLANKVTDTLWEQILDTAPPQNHFVKV